MNTLDQRAEKILAAAMQMPMNAPQLTRWLSGMALLTTFNLTAPAQVLAYTGGTLLQNFDGMGRLGTSTPSGWFVGFGTSANTAAVTPGMGLQAPTATILGWNLGSTNGAGANPDTDRALGSGPTGAGNDGIIEVRIANNSGQPIAAFEVRYDGEEWRTPQGDSPVDQLVLQFSTNGTIFTPLGVAFDFIRPVTSPATSALDGNLAANRTANRGGIFTPAAPIPLGATFYLRWFDVNDSGITDALLAIDNFRFTATNAMPVRILESPQSRIVRPGANTTFLASASGTGPLGWQWRFNGVDIPAANGSTLTLSNVTLAQDGFYSVRVSNAYSIVQSEPVRLMVDDQGLTPFHAHNFETGVGAEWSTRNTDVTPTGARKYLGQFSNQVVTLALSDLPAHHQVTVAFDLFIILSWNGNWVPMGPDRFTLRDHYGPVLLDTTFNNHPAGLNQECFDSGQAFPDSFPGGYHPPLTGAAETNSLGYEGWGWPLDAVYRLRYSWAHTNTDLLVDFIAAQLQTIDDESWGLDNVMVYLDNGAVAGWPIASNSSSLSVTNGQCRLQLTQVHGADAIVLETSTDLQRWDAVATNTPVNGTVDFTIPVGPHPHRFFRAKQ